jgi:DNA polymerase-1
MLATILDNAPLPIDAIPRFELTPERVQALHRVLEEYEFRSILKRLPALVERFGSAPAAVESVYETLLPESVRNPDEATLARLLEGDAPVGVRFVGALNRLRDAMLHGVALAVAPDRAVWLELGGSLFLPEPLMRLLNDPQRKRAVWDLKTECLLLRGAGVEARPADFDALLAAYLWQPSRATYTLDWLCEDVLRMRIPDDPDARPAAEACALLMLQPRLRDLLQREETLQVLESIELPLAPILAEMEWHGIRVDAPYLQELSVRLEADLNALAQDIYALAGEAFNIGSTKQLGAILFEKLGLPVIKKTKTGYSTDAEVLQTLAAEHPIAALIVKHRELSKLRSTYAEALPKLINPLTGRIHTKLNQTVTATGRLSSSEPNLQNIPIRTEIGREIRRAFIADPGYLLLSLDYSQIELRILAHMSGDPMLTAGVRTRGGHPHGDGVDTVRRAPRAGGQGAAPPREDGQLRRAVRHERLRAVAGAGHRRRRSKADYRAILPAVPAHQGVHAGDSGGGAREGICAHAAGAQARHPRTAQREPQRTPRRRTRGD